MYKTWKNWEIHVINRGSHIKQSVFVELEIEDSWRISKKICYTWIGKYIKSILMKVKLFLCVSTSCSHKLTIMFVQILIFLCIHVVEGHTINLIHQQVRLICLSCYILFWETRIKFNALASLCKSPPQNYEHLCFQEIVLRIEVRINIYHEMHMLSS